MVVHFFVSSVVNLIYLKLLFYYNGYTCPDSLGGMTTLKNISICCCDDQGAKVSTLNVTGIFTDKSFLM